MSDKKEIMCAFCKNGQNGESIVFCTVFKERILKTHHVACGNFKKDK